MLVNIINLIEEYVKLNYIVKRIGSKINTSHREIFSYVNTCRYDLFGISDIDMEIIEGDNVEKLEKLYNSYSRKLEDYSSKLFIGIVQLSDEEKKELNNILEYRVGYYKDRAKQERNDYHQLVLQIKQIQQRGSEANKNELYALCLMSKDLYSHYYECQIVSEVYSNINSYLLGIIGFYRLKK